MECGGGDKHTVVGDFHLFGGVLEFRKERPLFLWWWVVSCNVPSANRVPSVSTTLTSIYQGTLSNKVLGVPYYTSTLPKYFPNHSTRAPHTTAPQQYYSACGWNTVAGIGVTMLQCSPSTTTTTTTTTTKNQEPPPPTQQTTTHKHLRFDGNCCIGSGNHRL